MERAFMAIFQSREHTRLWSSRFLEIRSHHVVLRIAIEDASDVVEEISWNVSAVHLFPLDHRLNEAVKFFLCGWNPVL